jgi:hypothetical protein
VRPLKNAPGKLKHIKAVPAHLHQGKLRKFNRSLYGSGTASGAGRKEAVGVEYYLKPAICLKSAKMCLWRTFQKTVDNLRASISISYMRRLVFPAVMFSGLTIIIVPIMKDTIGCNSL